VSRLRDRASELIESMDEVEDEVDLTPGQEMHLATVRAVLLDLIDLCKRTGLDET